jgi:hypothetical protein
VTITAQSEYADLSLEELRAEHYLKNAQVGGLGFSIGRLLGAVERNTKCT